MIEKLEKLSAQMLKKAIKTYTLKDLLPHKGARQINLVEYCASFPNKGVGFKASRISWPAESYYLIKDTKYKSIRFGKMYGLKFWHGKKMSITPAKMNGCRKRGCWKIEFGDFTTFETDNKLVYTRKDYEAFYEVFKPLKAEAEPQQPNPQQNEAEQPS